MDAIEAIRTRRSVRKFSDRPVEPEKLQTVLEAARMAPSWANMQCCRFVVVQESEVKARISELSYVAEYFASSGYKTNPAQRALAEAPVVIVACADLRITSRYGDRGTHLYCIQDTAASVQNLLLAAYELGLGTCWVGAFKEEKVKEILDLPDNLRPVVIVPVGYPARTPTAPDRVPWTDVMELVP